jgi:hypothetical protein
MTKSIEEIRAHNRAYYAKNRDARLLYHAEYHKKNRERILAAARKYQQRPEVKARAKKRDRTEWRKAYNAANKERIAAHAREWRKANKELMSERRNIAYIKHRKDNLVRSAKHRARRFKVPFAISASDLNWPERCPVLDIPLEYETTSFRERSPSIDRLIPELGYVPGNVAVISMRANRLKNSATPMELEKLAAYTAAKRI